MLPLRLGPKEGGRSSLGEKRERKGRASSSLSSPFPPVSIQACHRGGGGGRKEKWEKSPK